MKAIIGLLMAAAMLLAACGDGAVEEPAAETTETAAETTTSEAAETTTSTATPATITTRPETSTTATPVASDDFEALIARVEAIGEPSSSTIEGSQQLIGYWSPLGFEDLTLRFSATRDGETGNTSFSMDGPALGQGVPDNGDGSLTIQDLVTTTEVREIGDTLYINMGSFTMPDGETKWMSVPREEGAGIGEMFSGVPDPARMLEAYRKADTRMGEVGRATVNGMQTTHYAITVDTEALLARISHEERIEIEAGGPVPNGTFPLDLWISDEGYLVRMVMEADGSLMHGPEGSDFERMILTFDVFDIGQPISIEAPPASEVTPIDD